ncbi:endonuclease III family protein [Parvularcula bermudensis HTCC2503]|uniref:Endonuclease III family protein n=1 Tax=Parvularcula bermudensis (strain ATCC BAA-594 / HTCC2503 / KCTC 12087) TaxID=314260 RepID=E0TIG9_PARBH|nr:endonuclease III family protein [Parvularcula bermudensis]ADM10288.1 endonuclease III family protein [Parvularcula bermudensis HTCC2503]
MQTSLDFDRDSALPRMAEILVLTFGKARRHTDDALRQLIFMTLAEGEARSVGLAVFEQMRRRYPNWRALSDASADDLTGLFVGLAHRRRKAEAIPGLLKAIEAESGGFDLSFLARVSTDAARRWLEKLPGVSHTMASAVLAFSSLNRAALPVDRASARPIRRLGLCAEGAPLSALGRQVLERAPASWDAEIVADFSYGLSRLAAGYCGPARPDCEGCPLSTLCPQAARPDSQVIAFPGGQHQRRRPAPAQGPTSGHGVKAS